MSASVQRIAVSHRLRRDDMAFRMVTRAAAMAVLVVLGGIAVALTYGAWPALRTFGPSPAETSRKPACARPCRI